MARQIGPASTPAQHKGQSEAVRARDEDRVRRYLRCLAGAPIRAGDDAGDMEAEFVAVVARWAELAGVDREALLALGVPRRVLDGAGVVKVPPNERLRRHWHPMPFSVGELARRAGISEVVVRKAVGQDEDEGVLRRVGRRGRTILYEVAD